MASRKPGQTKPQPKTIRYELDDGAATVTLAPPDVLNPFPLRANTSRLGPVFVKVGLVPDTGGLYLLTRLIGLNRAKELCFPGRMFSAAEAVQLGLVNRALPADQLMPAAQALARELADGAT